MLCGDVGQEHYEEVDLIEKGANYGWNGYEGKSCFKGYCEDAGHLETMRKHFNFFFGGGLRLRDICMIKK